MRNPTALVFENDVQCVNNTRDVTQNGKKNVKKQGTTTTNFQEYTKRRENDSKEDFKDVGASESHCVIDM
ncbi:hypothetical protein BABINDRAFT_163862 [Babjeviella inositovora NRRL Y-12698]|uniref:Uncharacterized protein n=1 Tax=Babjeviella inositovora NRRL Y-12698 TaxID=984486 RepID=A0A1E3QHG5_9ASCO|nr:uncharacterized protein BABINDRAFT_163862 [Babjeviella inositovora NRRL Y-12698]ODQ77136.1 hypothetical protein BABINDRAFT_163862 [Babjeviella inositovora NRRL Y-12698]